MMHCRLIIIAVAVACSWACATANGTPRPFPTPDHASATTSDRGDEIETRLPGTIRRPSAEPGIDIDVRALLGTALTLQGVRYRYGGSDPQGFDCSGFIQYVFAQQRVLLPREVHDQFRTGRAIALRELQPGDLLFFSTSARGASHVGMAIDDTRFVHAPSSTGVVRIERFTSSYWSKRFVGARRIP